MPSRLPIIGITLGDPAGIGPEIVLKALGTHRVLRACRPIVIGDRAILKETAARFGSRRPILAIEAVRTGRSMARGIRVLDLALAKKGEVRPGRASRAAGRSAAAAIRKAAQLAMAGEIDGVVTAPINKAVLRTAGEPFPGHTEFFASLSGSRRFGMMMVGGPLRVFLATIHASLKEVPSLLTRAGIRESIRLTDEALRKGFGIRRPRIGVAALNPHAGEEGLFGREEREIIRPAVSDARRGGIDASGPHPADTLFVQASRGKFDAVVAMYHDQGLIPLKLVAFGHAVNMTVGLPFIRTSVDHGTAYDIAGKGIADPGSLIEAILLAARLAATRR